MSVNKADYHFYRNMGARGAYYALMAVKGSFLLYNKYCEKILLVLLTFIYRLEWTIS
jgi:hypothetical protein